MSLNSVAASSLSEIRRLCSSVSGDESRSGISKSRTRSLPNASTQSAATTLLSTPPDTATTAP